MTRKNWEIENVYREFQLAAKRCQVCKHMFYFQNYPKCRKLMEKTMAGTIDILHICRNFEDKEGK